MASGKYEKQKRTYTGKFEKPRQRPTASSPTPSSHQRRTSSRPPQSPQQQRRDTSRPPLSAQQKRKMAYRQSQNSQQHRTSSRPTPSHEQRRRTVRRRKNSKKYIISKDMKKKLVTIALGLSLVAPIAPLQTSHAEVEASTHLPEQPKPPIIHTIGIINDDVEISVGDEEVKNFELDENTFVITVEDEVIAYDVHGNFYKGILDSEDFEAIMEISEEEMKKYRLYQINSDIDVNVRSSGVILKDNIISTVPSNDYVIGYKETFPENDKEWIYTISINNDKITEGYIRKDLLKEIDTIEALNYRLEKTMKKPENIKFVDTSKENHVSLKLRAETNTSNSGNILTEIPYGSLVYTLGQREFSNNRNWAKVLYEISEDYQFEGWVVEDYLTDVMVEEKNQVEDGLELISGNLTGIDISASIHPDDLRKLFQSNIPNEAKTENGNVNISELANNEQFDFAYIKIGSSPYGYGKFRPTEYDYYLEQVKVCEELGIPYGFYYYTTAITVKEANMELDCIKQRLEDLNDKYDLKYNKLDFVVDTELHVVKNEDGTTTVVDRQYKGDIKEQTEAKAALINGILEEELSDNVLIYGPLRVMKPDLDQIYSLEDLRALIPKSKNVNLWLCAPQQANGHMQSTLEEDIAYIEEKGFSTEVYQLVLDVILEGEIVGKIDINSMTKEHFDKLVNQEKTPKESKSQTAIDYSTQITEQDEER